MRISVSSLVVLTVLLATGLTGADQPGQPALIAVELQNTVTVSDLVKSGITVVRDMGRYALATAGSKSMATLSRLGLDWEILDDDTHGNTYFAVYSRDEPRLRTVMQQAEILRVDGRVGIIKARPEDAVALAAEGLEIARVFLHPTRLPPRDGGLDRTGRPLATQTDPVIEAMVDSISIDRINGIVQRLQDFVTRYTEHDSCTAASLWIKSQFESYGIDSVYLHDYGPRSADNVVAVVPGRVHPDRMIVIGGHYDSITPDIDICPGADDNASGTACILECARVLSGYEFDNTIVFIAFSGEEQGLLGSHAFASEAAARGDEIIGMIAVDMIGYVAPGDRLDLDVLDNPSSEWMYNRVLEVRALYVPELSVVDGTLMGGTSDHASFWQNGYHALLFYEDSDDHSPYIHTTADIVGVSYIEPLLAVGTVKLAAAFVADLATPFVVGINHEPLAHTSDESNPHRVSAGIYASGSLNSDSLQVRYRAGAGWSTITMSSTAVPDEFETFIPAQSGGVVVDYFIVAEDITGNRVTDPAGAPEDVHSFAVGTPAVVLEDDFESDRGWTVGDIDDNATAGIWEWGEPFGTY
ncbi:MAG: M28 family peptidase, partial [Candidatus Latescibacterota bacterium]